MSGYEYQFRLKRIRDFCKEIRREDAEASNQGATEEKVNPYHLYEGIRFPHAPSKSSEEEMANPIHNPTLKELATLMLDQQPLCIQFPETGAGFELKSELIHLLPKFYGLSGEPK